MAEKPTYSSAYSNDGKIYDGSLLKKSGKKIGNDMNHVESFMAQRLGVESGDSVSRSYRTMQSSAFPATTNQDAHNGM